MTDCLVTGQGTSSCVLFEVIWLLPRNIIIFFLPFHARNQLTRNLTRNRGFTFKQSWICGYEKLVRSEEVRTVVTNMHRLVQPLTAPWKSAVPGAQVPPGRVQLEHLQTGGRAGGLQARELTASVQQTHLWPVLSHSSFNRLWSFRK